MCPEEEEFRNKNPPTRLRRAFGKRPPAPRKPKGKPGRPFAGAHGGITHLNPRHDPRRTSASELGSLTTHDDTAASVCFELESRVSLMAGRSSFGF